MLEGDCLLAPSEVVCNMSYWCPVSVLSYAPSEVAQNLVELVQLMEEAPSVVALSVLLLVALVLFFLTVLLMSVKHYAQGLQLEDLG